MSYDEGCEIQVQIMGNWQTTTITATSHPQEILLCMEQLKRFYPDRRVRAVDRSGHLIDMLG